MIESIAFKFGAAHGASPLSVAVTPITIFVGPNYSGKSRALTEIANHCYNINNRKNYSIIENVKFIGLEENRAESIIDNLTTDYIGDTESGIIYTISSGQHQFHGDKKSLINSLVMPNENDNKSMYLSIMVGSNILVLNSKNRSKLTEDQNGGDLQEIPSTTFQRLFKDDILRDSLSQVVKKSIGSYLVVDPTKLGTLRLRLSKTPPESPAIERGLDDKSISFHSRSIHMEETSDGTKAFVGILSEIKAGNPKILFLDEPEAFLHPSLSFDLGREISKSIAGTDKRIFISTHNPQFVMGCIQSGTPLNIVRLTYNDSMPTARLLSNKSIYELMRNPLLRSTGVISSLFYQNVIVTEGDPDRAFYQEINERLVSVGRGVPNAIFLNAQSKQTIQTIVAPLRQLGIPTASIYDIDFIKDGGIVARRSLSAAGIPDAIQDGLMTIRSKILESLEHTGKNFKICGGINLLSGVNKLAADEYIDQLATYGTFIVKNGELESWFNEFEIGGHGPPWLIAMFERLGDDPNSKDYVRPSDEGVWAFMEKIANWLTNPNRKGIPS